MVLTIIFLISGFVLISLITAKHLETKTGRSFFILSTISRGNTQVRGLTRFTAHAYSDLKEWMYFFVHKQLPLHSRNVYNKSRVYLKEQLEARIGDIRGSRLLKKSDGISEFFRTMSEIEKGSGEINETVLAEKVK